MRLRLATALVAVTAALSLTGTASAWWFYVPPSSQQQTSNQEKKLEKSNEALASNHRG